MKNKKCDSCGCEFLGKSFPVYDENHQIIKGLVQCVPCFAALAEPEEQPEDKYIKKSNKLRKS